MLAAEILAGVMMVVAAGLSAALVCLVRARVRDRRQSQEALSALPGDGHIPPTHEENRPEVAVSPTGELKPRWAPCWAHRRSEEGPSQPEYAALAPKGEDPVTEYESLHRKPPPHTAAAAWHDAGTYDKLKLDPATRQPAANADKRFDVLPTLLPPVLPPRRQVADVKLAAAEHTGPTTADEDTGDTTLTLQSAPRRPTLLAKDHPLNATAMAPGAAHQPPMEVVDGVGLTKQEATNARHRQISVLLADEWSTNGDDGIMSLLRNARLRMEKRRNCDDPGSQAITAASGATPSVCSWAQLMGLEQDPTGKVAPGAPEFCPPLSAKGGPDDCKYLWVEASEQIDDDTVLAVGRFDEHGVPAHVTQHATYSRPVSTPESAYGLCPALPGTDDTYDHPGDTVNPRYMPPSSSSASDSIPEPLYNQPEPATGTDAIQAEPTSPDCQSVPVGRRSPEPMTSYASAAEVAAAEVAFYSKLLLSDGSHENPKIRRATDWNGPWAVVNRIEDSDSETTSSASCSPQASPRPSSSVTTAGDALDCQSFPIPRRSLPEENVPMRNAPEGRATRPPSYIRPPRPSLDDSLDN